MKATGIVRKVDDLGRIVLPIELRRSLGIDVKDPIEIYVDDDTIMLRKHDPSCVFCGATSDIVDYRDKKICTSCAKDLNAEVLAS